MRYATRPVRSLLTAALALVPSVALAQGGQPDRPVRSLSVNEAVQLALEQNLGIQIERFNPQIQDVTIAQTRASWAPTLRSDLFTTSTSVAATNVFAGGQNTVTDARFEAAVGMSQQLSTGTTYSFDWSSLRSTSTNFFNTYDPQLRSTVSFAVTQPLVRNFKIDNVRQQVLVNQKARDVSDLDLRGTIVLTTRNVKIAYWDLSYAINNLAAQRQSLQLAKQLLADNEKRVQIGTMAPIDIVEAQSEVARNEESVIVAEAAIDQAEDRLRALILDPAAPDFWSIRLEPADDAPFEEQVVDVNAAVRRALQERTDVLRARNNLEQNDITIQYLRNQSLPEVNANLNYDLLGVGGTRFQPVDFGAIASGGVPDRIVSSRRSYGSVLGDIVGNSYPAWTLGVSIGYPLGTSVSEANLAKARLQHTQAQTQLRNLELQVATQVRDTARAVQTNSKRVASARAARQLAERRLEAEEKKFAAGIQTSFFVFQAQRDLAQARTNEVRAVSDYNKSLVDLEAVQDAPLGAVSTAVAAVAVVR